MEENTDCVASPQCIAMIKESIQNLEVREESTYIFVVIGASVSTFSEF